MYEDREVFGIITNNIYLDQDDVVSLYNQRGAIEQMFADHKEMWDGTIWFIEN